MDEASLHSTTELRHALTEGIIRHLDARPNVQAAQLCKNFVEAIAAVKIEGTVSSLLENLVGVGAKGVDLAACNLIQMKIARFLDALASTDKAATRKAHSLNITSQCCSYHTWMHRTVREKLNVAIQAGNIPEAFRGSENGRMFVQDLIHLFCMECRAEQENSTFSEKDQTFMEWYQGKDGLKCVRFVELEKFVTNYFPVGSPCPYDNPATGRLSLFGQKLKEALKSARSPQARLKRAKDLPYAAPRGLIGAFRDDDFFKHFCSRSVVFSAIHNRLAKLECYTQRDLEAVLKQLGIKPQRNRHYIEMHYQLGPGQEWRRPTLLDSGGDPYWWCCHTANSHAGGTRPISRNSTQFDAEPEIIHKPIAFDLEHTNDSSLDFVFWEAGILS